MVRLDTTMLVVCLVSRFSTIKGYPNYVQLIPNGGEVPEVPNLGHLDPAGETGLSTFGEAFSKAATAWTALLCQEDTDGDGYTNGQELGDPCCTWTESNAIGLITKGISDPSNASKIPTNSELLAGCPTGGSAAQANSSAMADVVGTVAPGGPAMKETIPPDDDEDDSSESAALTAGASSAALHHMAMGMAMLVAIGVAW